ncbi:wall-associated receptor kinase 1-like [Cicer arietinum]|uniref:Uncharacterized protein LOC101508793 n=1 Tax=Cicer arietinum TaxID=3827 RepID=A0A1S2XAB1_CICAR|nr:uncharacterized protein LOC101508793 [Cicer arietinum]
MLLLFTQLFLSLLIVTTKSQSSICRTSCGDISIKYPFGIDDGCGSPFYRNILSCSESKKLELQTASGRYEVHNISYADPHIVVTDPFMWKCQDGENFRPTRPFSLDTSTNLKLSSQNEYMFFNCSEEHVIIQPRPMFCEHFPEHCESSCDTASYLCRHLPRCSFALTHSSCCSYYPKSSESLRLMLKYCTSYTSVYWRDVGSLQPYDQLPEYGIRVDFNIPVTTSCLGCQDPLKGGGTCGFDTVTQSFMCLCKDGNSSTHCKDQDIARHNRKVHVIAGTVTVFSAAGAFGIGAGIWYLKKVRAKAPATCGVQSNDNRLF